MSFGFVIAGILCILISLYYQDARYILLAIALFGIAVYIKKYKKKQIIKFKEDNKMLRYKRIFTDNNNN